MTTSAGGARPTARRSRPTSSCAGPTTPPPCARCRGQGAGCRVQGAGLRRCLRRRLIRAEGPPLLPRANPSPSPHPNPDPDHPTPDPQPHPNWSPMLTGTPPLPSCYARGCASPCSTASIRCRPTCALRRCSASRAPCCPPRPAPSTVSCASRCHRHHTHSPPSPEP